MVTINVFIYFTIMFYLRSVQSLKDIGQPSNNTGHIGMVVNFIDQIIAKNDSKLQEFSNIFHYFVNLTVIEKKRRKEIQKLTALDLSVNETRKFYNEDLVVINDIMNEENITADINETHVESVTDYIRSFVDKPENVKEKYIHNMKNYTNFEDEEDIAYESIAAEDFYDSNNSKENEFWDITETRRIYGGNTTKIKFFPFIASVHILNQFACAGSIISADLIITAASCLQLAWNNRFFRENPAFISVRVGSPYYNFGGEFISVLEVYFHPQYIPKTLHNNLALMRLRFRLKFRRKKRNVKKIAIDTKASPLPINTPGITIIGWGAKTGGNLITPMTARLHMAVLDFYDLISCREVYGKNYVTIRNFCAGFITKGTGACNHDVGDPGVSGRLLVGVTSFGSPACGKPDTPTVYTKIGYYADWIEEIMDQDVPEMKVRTTTRQSIEHNGPVILYGKHLRDDTAKHDELFSYDDQKLFGTPDSTESMIPPILSRESLTEEPQILLDPAALRRPRPTSRPPEPNTPRIIRNPQAEILNSEEDRDLGANSEYDMITRAATKIIGYDPNASREENIHAAKTSAPFKIDDSDALPDISESNHIQNSLENSKLSETDNVDKNLQTSSGSSDNNVPAKSTSSETGASTEAEDVKIHAPYRSSNHDSANSQKESDLDSRPMDSTEKYNLFTAGDDGIETLDPFSNYNHDVQSERNVQRDSRVIDTTKKKKLSATDIYSNQSVKEISLSDEDDETDDKTQNTKDNEYPEYIDAENNSEVGPELTEYMLKKEIDKLIRQLEVSSELDTVTEDDIITNNPRYLQDTFELNDRGTPKIDKAHLEGASLQEKDAINQLKEYLDLPNSKTEPELPDLSSEEGLSIDTGPFKKALRSVDNELMRRKEIYEIFADVLRTVINKTANF